MSVKQSQRAIKGTSKGVEGRSEEISKLVDSAKKFVLKPTPDEWLNAAQDNLQILLVDHANCEKKAASTALQLLYKYTDHSILLNKLSRLAREELRHFEQVLAVMKRYKFEYLHLSPSRYAATLMKQVRNHEPAKLVDTLIVGAIIEARSCERFAALVPILDEMDEKLADFYFSLLKSEARHYTDYLALAKRFSKDKIGVDDRVAELIEAENQLILTEDNHFRFHSGIPANEIVGA